jgi:hypothetical protein
MLRNNITLITIIFCVLIIVFTALLIRYFLNKQENDYKEGLENDESFPKLIVSLKSDSKLPAEKQLDKGNGIPAHVEYSITSLSTDGFVLDSRSTVFNENTPKQIGFESLNPVMHKNVNVVNQNRFIVISPKTAVEFPDNFTLTIENNVDENKMQFDLWGDTYINKGKPRPIGNSNTIIGPHNLSGYTIEDTSSFTYDKNRFTDGCFKKGKEKCVVNRLNIGKNIINVIQSGPIFDNKGNKIGHVTKTNRKTNNSTDTIEMNIENYTGATGILLYVGYTTNV